MAEYRYLHINVKSLEGIKPRKWFFFKKRYYAVVSSLENDTLISTQKTQLGKFQGNNNQYTWTFPNHPMRFYVEESQLQQNLATIMIQLRRKRHYFSKDEEDVGEICVPLKDLLDKSEESDDQNDTNKIVVYKVAIKNGKAHSAKVNVNLSYEFSRTSKPSGEINNASNDDVPWRLMRRSESSYNSNSSGPLKLDSILTINPVYYQSLMFYINSDMY